MAHPPQQPGFDPNQQPPQGPPDQTGAAIPPQPGYGPAQPVYGQQPAYGGIPPMPLPRKPRPGMVLGILIGSMAFIIVVGLVIGQMAGGGGPSASDTPEEVVAQYMDDLTSLWESKDFADVEATADQLAPYVCSEIRDEMSDAVEEMGDEGLDERYSEEELASLEEMEVSIEYEITDSAIDGDTAVVDLDVTTETTMGGEDSTTDDSSLSLDLVREDDIWLICDDSVGAFR
ncbi:hypothetical protein [Glycomyces tenuis]|uniref:Rv0361 family membrane protein n=1 Tax=Glycomyces tenuis TaxID=58116 RepID=UPI0003FF9092|nr:hypothetical protein [Glycomyces tenuis]